VNPYIAFPVVDEDIGHTLVHFFCTGTYETIRSVPDPGLSTLATEYRRSLQVYHAATKYKLHDLELFAKKHIEVFDESLPIFNILQEVAKIFSKLPGDEIWLRSDINSKLKSAFVLDETTFEHDEFFCGLREEQIFSETVMRMVVNIYSCHILSMRNVLENQSNKIECMLNQRVRTQDLRADKCLDKASPAEGRSADEPLIDKPQTDTVEDPIAEEYPTEESFSENSFTMGEAVGPGLQGNGSPDITLYENWGGRGGSDDGQTKRPPYRSIARVLVDIGPNIHVSPAT
jgi:hypothetical protein